MSAKGDGVESSVCRIEESPQQFAPLQFSPEAFGFPMSGPVTVPGYPQHKLFWDANQAGENLNIDFPMDDTFTTFGMGFQKNLDPFVSSQDHSVGLQFQQSPAFNLNLVGSRNDNIAPFPSPTHPGSPRQTVTSVSMGRGPSLGKLIGNGVDPSLLFSSPSRTAENVKLPNQGQAIQDDILRPYAHQMRDAQIEMEIQMARKSKRKRGPGTDSPAVKAALQTLREDQTGRQGILADSVIEADQRPQSRESSGRSRENRRCVSTSLQKRRSKSRLHVPHSKRTVTLTIDASGRASTETKVLADGTNNPSISGLHADSDSDDSTSSTSSSSVGMVISLSHSFAYPTQNQQQPKVGRFLSNSKSYSQKSSYTSTLGSSNAAKASLPNNRRTSILNIRNNSHGYCGMEIESEAETVIDTDDDGKGDAQSELKKVLQTRGQGKHGKRAMRSKSRDGLADQRRPYPPQSVTAHPYYTIGSQTPGQYRYQDPYSNISPTTITDPDLATPSSGQESNIGSDSTRCVCHSSDSDGYLMILW